MSAFLYLSWASARNRIAFQLRRIRTPRYVAALLVGMLYVYSFLLRPGVRTTAGSMLFGRPTEMLVTLLGAFTVMGTWTFGSDLTALAFTPAELSLLFPAPLSRRALIGYKLGRAQITVVFNALVWVVLLKAGGASLPPVLRAIGIWAMFSILNLHRLGAALVRTSWRQHGRSAVKRHLLPAVLLLTLVGLLVMAFAEHRRELFAIDSVQRFFPVLAHVLSIAPAKFALYPFHLAVAPAFARTTEQWSRAMLPVLGIVGVHVLWVLHTDTAFEEAAFDASAERARRVEATRARRSIGGIAAPRAPTSTLRLSPTGHPAIAILWKNLLCLRRTAQLRVLVGPAAMSIALGAAAMDGRADAGGFIGASAVLFAAMLLLFGGRLIRNDLRHDMLHLELLKSLPSSSSAMVAAEVASAALPIAGLQFALMIIAYLASFTALFDPLSSSLRLGILVASPFALVALNGALLTIQNGTAVLFPAWIRLGPTVNSGIEALGQNVLGTAANLFSLGIGLVIPAALGWGAVHLLHQRGSLAITLIAIIGSIVLVAETCGVMVLLGHALARAEPLQQ